MIIRMIHPLHGQMDVYTEVDAVNNEKNGWVREKNEIPAVEIGTLSLAEQYEKKFGKKPHHRMSQSTIEAALKD